MNCLKHFFKYKAIIFIVIFISSLCHAKKTLLFTIINNNHDQIISILPNDEDSEVALKESLDSLKKNPQVQIQHREEKLLEASLVAIDEDESEFLATVQEDNLLKNECHPFSLLANLLKIPNNEPTDIIITMPAIVETSGKTDEISATHTTSVNSKKRRGSYQSDQIGNCGNNGDDGKPPRKKPIHTRNLRCPLCNNEKCRYYKPEALRKNQREQARVERLNGQFKELRKRLPGYEQGQKDKRQSKVKTLRSCIQYIHFLQNEIRTRGNQSQQDYALISHCRENRGRQGGAHFSYSSLQDQESVDITNTESTQPQPDSDIEWSDFDGG